MKYLDNITPNIMEILSTLTEGVDYIRNCKIDEIEYLLNDMDMVIDTLIDSINSIKHKILLPNKLFEIQNNIKYSFQRILLLYDKKNFDEFKWRFDCEFTALILCWQSNLQFYLVDGVDKDSLKESFDNEKEYIQELYKLEKKDPDYGFKFDVSIIVLFYNNKKMTEDCINSIYKYTKDINYELITIDNGSDDETTEWCNNLTHIKKIHYKYNMGPTVAASSILSSALYTTEGKYTVFVSNDVIVTKNWLNNLLKCIISDEKIFWASPVCNSLSNMQTVSTNYNTIDQMQEFAMKYNVSDKNKWEERARLFPFLSIFKSWVLEELGGYCSPYFCYDMFADDDMSMKIRRAGYKQILCRDTFVHHYGSATLKESQFDVMDKGRKQFYDKYGIDAWLSLGIDNVYYIDLIKNDKKEVSILTVNPMFGETTLAIKNKLKSLGCKNVHIDSLVEDKRYLYDAKVISENSFLMNDMEKSLLGKQYDYIILNGNVEDYEIKVNSLLNMLHKCVKADGVVLLMTKNPYHYKNICKVIGLEKLNENYYLDNNLCSVVKYIDPQILENEIRLNNYNLLNVINICSDNNISLKLVDKLSKVFDINKIDNYKNVLSVERQIYLLVK